MINVLERDIVFIGSSAPVAPQFFAFGFNASHIFIKNDSAAAFRTSLSTATTLSTANGLGLSTGEERFWQELQSGCPVFSLISTSSSTAGLSLRLGAWG